MEFNSIKNSLSSEDDNNGISADQLLLIYTLELNGFNENKLFRCEKSNHLRFVRGSSLYGKNISLMTNYNDDFKNFERNKMTKIDLNKNLQMLSSGSFHFIYIDNDDNEKILGSFYIVVLPDILINDLVTNQSKTISINSLQCQTILSKLMGPLDTWKDKLMVSIKCHYNLIHWTPIQQLGISNSAYSLANQHRINQTFCTENMKKEKQECKLEDVAEIIDWLQKEHNVISITDIVLNHTANESSWLREHPECAYNCQNSPWLRPAFLLDRLLWNFTLDIENGRWNDKGISTEIDNDNQMEIIKNIIHQEYLPLLNLEEFYLCDMKNQIDKFNELLQSYSDSDPKEFKEKLNRKILQDGSVSEIKIKQDPEYHRLNCSVDIENAFKFISKQIEFELKDSDSVKQWLEKVSKSFEEELNRLNEQKRWEYKNHIYVAIDNVLKGARYERFDPNGPKLKKLTKKSPLTTQYFTDDDESIPIKDWNQKQSTLYDPTKSCYYMAHNGWVMGDDPLRNFAEKDSLVYLRRELICWGDSVKLRYGQCPSDSPFLWSFMKEYVIQMASKFQGLRLDNCHSTPIHVAQYLLDAARRVNPNLYLIAELFTSSEELDNLFVNKLGINSLIREAMSAGTPFELGRQVYLYGGEPVGSFSPDSLSQDDNTQKKNLYSRPLVPSVTHAIFFDQTHDNESPIVRRTAYDPLPSAALISMTYAATGSNRGFDELIPHHIHVVNETRQYKKWSDEDSLNGIMEGKRYLNQLHNFLNSKGYSQAFVDQRDRDTIAITRHNPNGHKSIVLIARTAFYPLDQNYSSHLEPLKVEGKFQKILFEMSMQGKPDPNFQKDPNIINGYVEFKSSVNVMVDKDKSIMIDLEEKTKDSINLINFKHFPPSSVIALSFSLLPEQNEALKAIQKRNQQYYQLESDISKIINKLNLLDLNYVLFRCNQEEMDECNNGVYNLSNGPLVYCGLAGIMFPLAKIRTHNDLGHPLCSNLREGNWLMDYIVNRLNRHSNTSDLAKWLKESFQHLSVLPRYLIPRYFDSILCPLYTLLLDKVWKLHSDLISNGDEFIRRLALGGVVLIGSHPPSPLPPLHQFSIPESFENLLANQLPTISAGLPHFSSGYMRNWGRDTFISLKGCCLLTGRFDTAKVIILGFAGCLRHGLIPNLLDGGKNSRYNCRDAVWWWLQAIKDYIQIVPEGHEILEAYVRRIFPTDHSPPLLKDSMFVLEPLHKTMQEALQRHFIGIDFIERNAGTQIDAHMTMEGFKIKVGVNKDTGFVYGGNQHNCGTWMDKMGSSDKAGNRGRPATPRDGSAVEIVALSYSVLSFLAKLNKDQIYPYGGVVQTDGDSWSFDFWSKKIQENFEKYFYIDQDCQDQYVHRKNIYKDTYGATIPWMDYQLRPNILVAMSIAPDLFQPNHAIEALKIVRKTLIGPLGVKTLDPNDLTYRGDYDNSNDSTDASVAHGFNYHNGPEWLWPMGHYIIASLRFSECSQTEMINRMEQIMSKHFKHLSQSEWYGLPELTNSDGKFCPHSCTIQAWSHATLIEALYFKNTIKPDA